MLEHGLYLFFGVKSDRLLEPRVAELEENRVHWDQVLTGVEGTVALILNEQRDKFKEIDKQFNKIEALLIQIVNNLASK